MTTGKDAATLLLENEAMRLARIEDHRTCEALRRSLTETQDKLRAEVDRATSLAKRLDAANADVQRLSMALEEQRDVNIETNRVHKPLLERCLEAARRYPSETTLETDLESALRVYVTAGPTDRARTVKP